MSWSLHWAARRFSNLREYREHAAVLRRPSHFYLAVLRKLIPGLSRKAIILTLQDRHAISVQELMTLVIYKEIFVDRCYDVIVGRCNPVIVDIGANTGLFALRMKQLFPSSRVICFEPFPSNFARLQETIKVNQLDAVIPVQKAVGARAGTTRLYLHKTNMCGHSLYPRQASSDRYVNVDVVELRSILDDCPDGVDLLKVDCEGAEFEILMHLDCQQAAKIHQLVVEPSPELYDVNQLLAHMTGLGYSHYSRRGLFLFSRPNVYAPTSA